MAAMAVVAGGSTTRSEEPLTLEDFEALRDAADGHRRYQLVDGCLLVTPSPTWRHQRMSGRLESALVASNPAPERWEVLHAPFDIRLGPLTRVEPDIMVFTDVTVADPLPVLVAEILSPSTRHIDLGLKRSLYAEAGIPHYWVLDPVAVSVLAWTLQDGSYVRVAEGRGEDDVDLPGPWTVRVKPSSLVRRA